MYLRFFKAYLPKMKLHQNIAFGIVQGLELILKENKALKPTLNKVLKQNRKWGSRDRRFVGEGVLEIVRWQKKLAMIGKLDINSDNYYWNLLGVWIISKELQLPDWSNFSELNKEAININLIPKTSKRAFTHSIPDWLDEMGMKAFGKIVWEKEIKSLNEKATITLRTNTIKTTALKLHSRLKKKHQIFTSFIPGFPDALILNEHKKLTDLNLYKNGWFEFQDTNSQKVALLANPTPGMFVIDACAGTGGKTLHLAALMKNKGRIIAIEPSKNKRNELENRLKRSGVEIVSHLSAENKDIFIKYEETADIVLIDAPCSGLGVLKRNPAAKWHMNPERIKKIIELQQQILQKYAALVSRSGFLVYATCSIFPKENKDQITRFLGSKIGKEFQLVKEITLLTHKTHGDGFYIAKLLKSSI